MPAWLLSRAGAPDPVGIAAVVAIDVAVNSFDALKGKSGSAQRALMDARLKEVCRRHRRARNTFAGIHRRQS